MKNKIISIVSLIFIVGVVILILSIKIVLDDQKSIYTLNAEVVIEDKIDMGKQESYNSSIVNLNLENVKGITRRDKFVLSMYLGKLNYNDYIKVINILNGLEQFNIEELKYIVENKLLVSDYEILEKIIDKIRID